MMRWLLALGLFCVTTPAVAHDVWLRPGPSRPTAAGELVKVDLHQGHVGEAEVLARNERKRQRFEARGPREAILDLPGLHGQVPAGLFRPSSAGLWAVLYEGNASLYRLPAERFERYLAEEGLQHVVAERRRTGTSGKEGREWVSRSLKALVPVGEVSALVDTDHGLEAELVLVDLDHSQLRLRLLVQGEPASDVLVDVQSLEGGERLAAPTTEEGVVSWALEPTSRIDGGSWMASAVIARPSSSPEAEWRTYFTTLTFPWINGRAPAHSD